MNRKILVFFVAWGAAFGQHATISTFAGGPPGSAAPVAGLKAALGQTEAVVADGAGNLYISTSLQCVFKLDANGMLTRIAGNGYPGFAGDGGPAAQSALNFGIADIGGFAGGALAIDKAGNLYIADFGNQRIRKISAAGTISTIAGTGDWGDRGDGGPAVNADLGSISGLAVDGAGNVYVADRGYKNRIREITPDGTINTIAASASLNLQDMAGLAADSAGNLYVADTAGNRVLEISAAGSVQTVVGTGTAGHSGDGGPAIGAQLNGPFGLAVDAAANVYIADAGNSRVRQVATDGTIRTIAGGGPNRGLYNGPATSAALVVPYALAVDAGGNLVIADTGQNLIRKVSGGNIVTLAGNGGCCDAGDGGPATAAQFGISLPSDYQVWGGALAFDSQGDLYIADTGNLQIRMISPDGIVTRIAGTGATNEDTGDNGPALNATINYPYGLATDSSGNLYIADGLIREVMTNGEIVTAAVVIAPLLDLARSLAVDASGNLVFGSFGGAQRVLPGGKLSAVTPEVAWTIVADTAGNLFLGDIEGFVVRKVAPDGTVTIVAGNGTQGFSGDGGLATGAQLNTPAALAVDADGHLYIADSFNHRIRVVTTDGKISTIAGNGTPGYSGDGGDPLNAQFGLISGMAVDKAGNLYLADQTYNVIRVVRGLPN